ncbi:MAG: hypothetical protein K8R41_13470 [Bacteroidales bacterium]|nr:hypothetical protein [Bacteroidales bacterium]
MKKLVLFFFVITILYSCNKNENEPDPVVIPQSSEYTIFNVGSYWVYDWYKIDTLGNETSMNKTDSIYVSKDTVINGETYRLSKGTRFGNMPYSFIVRDSNNYIVNQEGNIIFSATNFSDILFSDSTTNLVFITYQMTDKDSIISVPAGSFETYNCQGTVIPLNTGYSWGIRYIDKRYAKGIGQILNTSYYFSQPDYMEQRLVRYHIEQ